MGLCGWIIFGFLVGLLARAITPGQHRMGFVRTTLLGIIGSFIGGLLGALISGHDVMVLHPSGFLGAVLGAVILLALGGWLHRST
ncbi:MAG TPA: GlsB/YeaQ/YmgE family stress response membrane protein [Myxococcaceae bacterium]|nr:GlsB/YeaQ/YmgE family stress response membrane protein [Myxococcaceae bacterium]